jgi:hypothetical protein
VFSILLNVARTRGQREHRILPFAALRERETHFWRSRTEWVAAGVAAWL